MKKYLSTWGNQKQDQLTAFCIKYMLPFFNPKRRKYGIFYVPSSLARRQDYKGHAH